MRALSESQPSRRVLTWHRRGELGPWGLLYKGTNPIREGLPQALPPSKVTWSGGVREAV